MSKRVTRPAPQGVAGEPSYYGWQMRATATKLTIAERAKGIRGVATPTKRAGSTSRPAEVTRAGKSVKCRANKSTGDESGANQGHSLEAPDG